MLKNLKYLTIKQPQLEEKRQNLLNSTIDLFAESLSKFSVSTIE